MTTMTEAEVNRRELAREAWRYVSGQIDRRKFQKAERRLRKNPGKVLYGRAAATSSRLKNSKVSRVRLGRPKKG